ncbi:protein-glutamine glutaminase family protein [Sphingobium baderi]|uniref:Protein glutaminase domain-containing protein n=1 Tax=Sphingobium baderi LL03 TaxID=1114964 RepID=T0GN43_9SPHN|nr:protein-glutamine glutaminase family protein [Sphingobium baderi]EQB02102.1 hypothetical protein L485_08810 [Sphingobium baderi LL03]KMS54739.1 hypothetical protein V475_21310 [Sphingobium baderi LL03]
MRLRAFKLAFAGIVSMASTLSWAEPFPPTTPEFVQIDENRLWIGNQPNDHETTTAPAKQLEQFFQKLQAEHLEYRYIVGSCEDRAHFITMLARKSGLPVSKIWAIAPARTTLLSRELITIADPFGVTSKVTWGHHVAPVVLIDNGTPEPDAMVIDMSISPKAPMPLREWMAMLGSPRATYFVTSSNDYLFWSANGFIAANNSGTETSDINNVKDPNYLRIPGWFPNILTGDFQKYDSGNWDGIIADGLAKNDLAMAIFDNKMKLSAKDAATLKEVIKFEATLSNFIADPGSSGLASSSVTAVISFHAKRRTHWLDRIKDLK